MYERFYNLRERPFALSPDPEYLYLSRAHGEALDSIRYGIESRAGFIVVTGKSARENDAAADASCSGLTIAP